VTTTVLNRQCQWCDQPAVMVFGVRADVEGADTTLDVNGIASCIDHLEEAFKPLRFVALAFKSLARPPAEGS
jgi:hypothetical protein